MIVGFTLPADIKDGEWPDEVRVAHLSDMNEGRAERAMVYVPARKTRHVVICNPDTDNAIGTCKCGNCGGSIGQDDRFCRFCGAEACDA